MWIDCGLGKWRHDFARTTVRKVGREDMMQDSFEVELVVSVSHRLTRTLSSNKDLYQKKMMLAEAEN